MSAQGQTVRSAQKVLATEGPSTYVRLRAKILHAGNIGASQPRAIDRIFCAIRLGRSSRLELKPIAASGTSCKIDAAI